MVNYCRVLGCHNRTDRENDKQYYRLPEVVTRESEKTKEMTIERRRLWLGNLNQDFTGKNLNNIRVCSDHFVSKKKADLYDRDNPDWAPTVDMGPKQFVSTDLAQDRFQRRLDSTRKGDAARTLLNFSEGAGTFPDVEVETDPGISCQTDITCSGITAMDNEILHLNSNSVDSDRIDVE